MRRLLGEIEFRDSGRALDNITQLARDLTAGAQARLRSLLPACADPEAALHFLERLHREQQEAFRRLTATPSGLQVLVAVFSHSCFLAEAILAHPDWVDQLLRSADVDRVLSAEEFMGRLERFLENEPGVPRPLSLALFRRQQILRTLVRDVLGLCTLSEATEELSNLADAVLDVSYRRIREELVRRYGAPRAEGGPTRESGFTVISLGKLGGRELNYSSDIDLMFLYSENGETDGPGAITNKEFFRKVANQLTDLLSIYTAEGMCYRVDLRLRPDGRFGEVCTSLEGARNYYRNRARDWELQMLIKGRVSAGDRQLGSDLLEFVEPLIYSTTLDFSVIESASATRERMSEKLAARKGAPGGFDVKLARGGIRDIEFLVQCLQRLHGGREPWVRHGGTLLALFRLRDKGLLSDKEYSRLASAYEFLRTLEHRLQVLEDRQTHTLPTDPEQIAILARKMPAAEVGGGTSAELFLGKLKSHLEAVQEIYERVIHAQQPMYYTPSYGPAVPTATDGPPRHDPETAAEPAASNLVRFLDQRAPKLGLAFARSNLRRGRAYFEHLLERILHHHEWLEDLNEDPALAGHVLDLLEHSPYLAEQLVRRPELLVELRGMRERAGPEVRYQDLVTSFDDAGELRRFFRREMFRIQCESICLGSPIFPTLERTSDLADAIIAAAYRMAVEQVSATHASASPGYQALEQMMVIALGRLGMREFDLASDADLVFVLPEADIPEHQFWTRVAERLIALISAYTGDGTMFAVDTRLRPNGRAGPLVQSDAAFKDYFSKTAQAWEGITYMKSRAVAGNLERATEFLHELQEVDWRRYGQSGRSRKQLAQMRMRLDKEQGAGNPLKAGRGGFYDIDFALMYLRLKGAGIFYKVLNTPARIDVIEKMGHLERPDAEFLRDAATFYRAVDHGLRVSTGHAASDLPTSESQLEMLTALVRRWTPDHLHDQPLEVELAQIQARTREFFDRLFQL
jgi:glutamate-ammonia-ligase adenylyltransferase